MEVFGLCRKGIPVRTNFLYRIAACVMAAIVSISGTASAATQTSLASTSTCQAGGVLFGFFNGVSNTPSDAVLALDVFKGRYGAISSQGDQMKAQE